MELKKSIVSLCRLNGFALNNEATCYLVSQLNPIPADERGEFLERLLDTITSRQFVDSSPFLTASILSKCVEEQRHLYDSRKLLRVIDAFSFPRFIYDDRRRKLVVQDDNNRCNLHGNADDKRRFYSERYRILLQRTNRHHLFQPPLLGNGEDDDKSFQLKPVEYLLATNSRLGNVIVLGMLSQLKEGKFYLEDLTGAVELDLNETKFHPGLITENCFVLAEGFYDDGVFHVEALGFPPAETEKATRTYFGNDNLFGGPHPTSVKCSVQLSAIEQENPDAMLVFLSDVWLNEIEVQNKLNILFEGFSESPPVAFVFIGNFLSVPLDAQSSKLFVQSLKNFSNLISSHPNIVKNSKFIFVPGARDPGMGNILPRPPIPSCLTNEFCRKVPNAVFTTNPCRIQYCTKQIMILREDIITKICRNVIRMPESGDIPTHFAKTLISQSYICPLPLPNAPVYWTYDHCLWLYPLPDVVVCADKFNSYSTSLMDCTFFNPGSFPTNNFNFKVYMAASGEVEDSQIQDEEN